MPHTVYEIFCITNGCRYIGCTNDFQRRKGTHLAYARNGYKLGHPLYDAIRRYGEQAFHFSELAAGLTLTEAYALESELIRKGDYTTREKGFNLTSGGLDWHERSARAVQKRREMQAKDPEAFRKAMSARTRAQHAKTTPEYRSDLARRRDAKHSAEYLSQRGRNASSKVSKEAHARGAAKRAAARTPEQHTAVLEAMRQGKLRKQEERRRAKERSDGG